MNHYQNQDLSTVEYFAKKLLETTESVYTIDGLHDITLPPLTIQERYRLRGLLMDYQTFSSLLFDALTAPKPPTRKERILARLKSLLKK